MNKTQYKNSSTDIKFHSISHRKWCENILFFLILLIKCIIIYILYMYKDLYYSFKNIKYIMCIYLKYNLVLLYAEINNILIN